MVSTMTRWCGYMYESGLRICGILSYSRSVVTLAEDQNESTVKNSQSNSPFNSECHPQPKAVT